jgi:hypothetical protein
MTALDDLPWFAESTIWECARVGDRLKIWRARPAVLPCTKTLEVHARKGTYYMHLVHKRTLATEWTMCHVEPLVAQCLVNHYEEEANERLNVSGHRADVRGALRTRTAAGTTTRNDSGL